MHTHLLKENLQGRDHFEDLVVECKVRLKWIPKEQSRGAWTGTRIMAGVWNTAKKIRFPQICGLLDYINDHQLLDKHSYPKN
jgi:hypothetical protein